MQRREDDRPRRRRASGRRRAVLVSEIAIRDQTSPVLHVDPRVIEGEPEGARVRASTGSPHEDDDDHAESERNETQGPGQKCLRRVSDLR